MEQRNFKKLDYERIDESKRVKYDGRRIPVDGSRERTWTVKTMQEKHHRVAQLLVMGYKADEVGRLCNMTKTAISLIRNSPVVQNHMAIMMQTNDKEAVTVHKRILELAPKCLDVIERQLDNPETNEAVNSKNAFGILALAGESPTRNINVNSSHVHFDAKDIEDIRKRAINAGIEGGVIIDV